ncbi:bifunctional diaminohydroxyphosphoribosylaminopyrimidine deaminase/5-amino-6-(5-phosphoribosylamino)uracil reductase RibD [Taibaiella lutea]|uniref:Riboflavin biosynthesis protein RibD n=1 Tax=Taibaiella lutea TaxID=2608001 RepID=A0A5M6CI18_9BACT|nr:bifunctional diaminohydroxyphosphoribosylaminopyrimidine deaminase/5-amino-6-(5-phosphoribosylamino)uracil reductase RibD [Taibaiella lutea]KAA5534858.1 bifunctional diaminohydroxyphosphoribosylaminopyrimidine deaminase/5-amino-6-(5-phosphoribosylamino)uracil reductase RibD [Taibaiella lutea]
MVSDKEYMQRCLELAIKGSGNVSPNPMVGAVLVYNDRIIGEGWHRQYGQAHAEVNCIASVKEGDKQFIGKSTIYVSLEPCVHYGKTPPCADLIIQHNIPKVVIGCTDTFNAVSGKGIAKLKEAGIEVVMDVLEHESRWLNRRFFCRQEKERPYVILKWAESDNGYIAPLHGNRVMLSNEFSQKWVHKMRSEEDAILIGHNTALLDNPVLNNRFGEGKNPVRVVLDFNASLPQTLHLFDTSQQTIVFNFVKNEKGENLAFIKLDKEQELAARVLKHLQHINSVIIEGGSKTLQLFLDANLWDEAFIISTSTIINDGTAAPKMNAGKLLDVLRLQADTIKHYQNEYSAKL